MEKRESLFGIGAGESSEKDNNPVEKKQFAIDRFVRMSQILEQEGSDENTEKEIEIALKEMAPEEKALRIYEGVVTYSLERRAEKDRPSEERTASDPYFISEFKQLWGDEEARSVFLQKFGETRFDQGVYRLSELGSNLREIERSIQVGRHAYAKLKQDLNLQRVKKPTEVKSVKARLERQSRRIEDLLDDERRIVNLEGYEHTEENTDVAALVMYETLRRYQRESKEGFAWLPSRSAIHKKINDVIEHTGKAPVLVGPPGTGKTTQVEAVAHERTGVGAIRIACNSGLGEDGLVYIRDIKGGEGVNDYRGTIAEAATGYEFSSDKTPAVEHGRMVSLDEISQLNLERALGPIKDVRQARVGKSLSRIVSQEVLPGFQLAATTNVPIDDERLDREFARIPVNYFEMTPNNPELYEFMLAKLLHEEGHLPLIDKRIIAPAYQKQDIPEVERKPLKNGDIPVAVDTLIENPADALHGFLYSFAGAIRVIQDSYIHGSQFNEKHLAKTAIYEDYDSDGNVVIKGYVDDLDDQSKFPGGTMLKLKYGSSTITAEIVSKWMEGFVQSDEKDITKWLQNMIREHIDQTRPEDAERIKAIVDYFYIFDEAKKESNLQPLTAKEIGYLSPRVPRPVYVEKPVEKAEDTDGSEGEERGEIKEYETREVLLEDGTRVLMKIIDIELENGVFDLDSQQHIPAVIDIGEKFRVEDQEFVFNGIVQDENSEYNGLSVGKISGEDLHKVFTQEQLSWGLMEQFKYSFDNNFLELQEEAQLFWEEECGNEPQPQW